MAENNKITVKGFINQSEEKIELIPTAHEHVITDITGLENELNNKASKTHTHTIGDVTGLANRLSDLTTGKASITHSHNLSDITDFETTVIPTLNITKLDGAFDGIDKSGVYRVILQDETNGKKDCMFLFVTIELVDDEKAIKQYLFGPSGVQTRSTYPGSSNWMNWETGNYISDIPLDYNRVISKEAIQLRLYDYQFEQISIEILPGDLLYKLLFDKDNGFLTSIEMKSFKFDNCYLSLDQRHIHCSLIFSDNNVFLIKQNIDTSKNEIGGTFTYKCKNTISEIVENFVNNPTEIHLVFALFGYDSKPAENSNNLLTSGAIYNALANVTVQTDAQPRQGSTNAVQSGGVYSALLNKFDKDTDVDDAPNTEHTKKVVSSKGIANALLGKASKNHTHNIQDINGLESNLNDKMDYSSLYDEVTYDPHKYNIKKGVTSNGIYDSVNKIHPKRDIRIFDSSYPNAESSFNINDLILDANPDNEEHIHAFNHPHTVFLNIINGDTDWCSILQRFKDQIIQSNWWSKTQPGYPDDAKYVQVLFNDIDKIMKTDSGNPDYKKIDPDKIIEGSIVSLRIYISLQIEWSSQQTINPFAQNADWIYGWVIEKDAGYPIYGYGSWGEVAKEPEKCAICTLIIYNDGVFNLLPPTITDK